MKHESIIINNVLYTRALMIVNNEEEKIIIHRYMCASAIIMYDDHGVHITKQQTPKKTDVAVSLFVVKKRHVQQTNLGHRCVLLDYQRRVQIKNCMCISQRLTYSRVDSVNK